MLSFDLSSLFSPSYNRSTNNCTLSDDVLAGLGKIVSHPMWWGVDSFLCITLPIVCSFYCWQLTSQVYRNSLKILIKNARALLGQVKGLSRAVFCFLLWEICKQWMNTVGFSVVPSNWYSMASESAGWMCLLWLTGLSVVIFHYYLISSLKPSNSASPIAFCVDGFHTFWCGL